MDITNWEWLNELEREKMIPSMIQFEMDDISVCLENYWVDSIDIQLIKRTPREMIQKKGKKRGFDGYRL